MKKLEKSTYQSKDYGSKYLTDVLQFNTLDNVIKEKVMKTKKVKTLKGLLDR